MKILSVGTKASPEPKGKNNAILFTPRCVPNTEREFGDVEAVDVSHADASRILL